jgi:hypothetical protein
MNLRKSLCVAAITVGFLLPCGNAMAKKAKEYQVTGPVVSVEENIVTIQKDDEKWEIELGADTKIEGKLKAGEKVTIYYHMVANKIDRKSDAGKGTKDSKKK